jgi:SOS-response transcriptional repressor LexA
MTETKTPPPVALTERQAEVLAFIEKNSGMYGPTVREIAAGLGIRSPNGVTGHLDALEKKGVIRRKPNCVRGIEVIA